MFPTPETLENTSMTGPPLSPIVPAPEFYKDVWGPAVEPMPPAISEMMNLRQEATDATNNATDQYEADVADYKNILATEAEQGIGSLPEFKKDVFDRNIMTPRPPLEKPVRKYFSDNIFQPNSQAPDIITGSEGIPNDPFASSYLNSGLSQLPSNQQNDTLTTQVFQSGFRPKRKGRR